MNCFYLYVALFYTRIHNTENINPTLQSLAYRFSFYFNRYDIQMYHEVTYHSHRCCTVTSSYIINNQKKRIPGRHSHNNKYVTSVHFVYDKLIYHINIPQQPKLPMYNIILDLTIAPVCFFIIQLRGRNIVIDVYRFVV